MEKQRLDEKHLCEILAAVTRYIDSLRKDNLHDAQIFKDILTKEMQNEINFLRSTKSG
jgi:hypothetical protein